MRFILDHLSEECIPVMQLLYDFPIVKIGYMSEKNYSEKFENLNETENKDWIVIHNDEFYYVSSLVNDGDMVEFIATKEYRLVSLAADIFQNYIRLTIESTNEMVNEKFMTLTNGIITSELGFRNLNTRVEWNNKNEAVGITYYEYNLPNGFSIYYNKYLKDERQNIHFINLNDLIIKISYVINNKIIKFQIKNKERFTELLLEHRKYPFDNKYATLLLECIEF